MAQRGFYEGLRLLCQFGADTQDVFRLMTGLPGTTFGMWFFIRIH
jgi:hypothetical protein